MDLILWRHAEAEESDGELPDAKRRLTPRGEKQAQKMAAWLTQRLPKKLTILVSPAVRTQQTAHALGLPFELEKRIAVGASAQDLLHAAQWPDNNRAVLVVGHQPTLGQAAGILITGQEASLAVKKGAIWWLSRRDRENGAQTVVKAIIGTDLI